MIVFAGNIGITFIIQMKSFKNKKALFRRRREIYEESILIKMKIENQKQSETIEECKKLKMEEFIELEQINELEEESSSDYESLVLKNNKRRTRSLKS